MRVMSNTPKALMMLTLVSFFFVRCKVHYDDYSRPVEPGKCFAKVLRPIMKESHIEKVPVYDGPQDTVMAGLKRYTYIKVPKSTKWVKKKANKNCLSPNPEDCMVWCLVNAPAQTSTIQIVEDTATIKDYVMKSIPQYEEDQENAKERMQVVCKEDLPNVILEVESRLIALGYLADAPGLFTDEAIREALVNYQSDHLLAIGSFTIESLDHLGIEY